MPSRSGPRNHGHAPGRADGFTSNVCGWPATGVTEGFTAAGLPARSRPGTRSTRVSPGPVLIHSDTSTIPATAKTTGTTVETNKPLISYQSNRYAAQCQRAALVSFREHHCGNALSPDSSEVLRQR